MKKFLKNLMMFKYLWAVVILLIVAHYILWKDLMIIIMLTIPFSGALLVTYIDGRIEKRSKNL